VLRLPQSLLQMRVCKPRRYVLILYEVCAAYLQPPCQTRCSADSIGTTDVSKSPFQQLGMYCGRGFKSSWHSRCCSTAISAPQGLPAVRAIQSRVEKRVGTGSIHRVAVLSAAAAQPPHPQCTRGRWRSSVSLTGCRHAPSVHPLWCALPQ
jgi:hypothetical protein